MTQHCHFAFCLFQKPAKPPLHTPPIKTNKLSILTPCTQHSIKQNIIISMVSSLANGWPSLNLIGFLRIRRTRRECYILGILCCWIFCMYRRGHIGRAACFTMRTVGVSSWSPGRDTSILIRVDEVSSLSAFFDGFNFLYKVKIR